MAKKSPTWRLAGLWLALLALRLAGGIDGIRVAPRVLGRAGHGDCKLQSGASTWRWMPTSVLQLRGGADGGGMAENMEEVDGLGEDEKLPADERIVKGELENGFRYILMPNKTPKQRFLCNLVVFAGSAHEKENQQGLAHYLEHCVFLGTDKYKTSQDMDAMLSSMGCSPHADNNAATDFTSTVFTLSASLDPRPGSSGPWSSTRQARDVVGRGEELGKPASARIGHKSCGGRITDRISDRLRTCDTPVQRVVHALVHEGKHEGAERMEVDGGDDEQAYSHLHKAVGLLHQLGFHASLSGTSIETEKAVVLAELRDGNTVDSRVAQLFYRQIFNETMLPRRFPIGNEASLLRFTASDLRTFYEEHYTPDNMCLLIVGDITKDELERCLESSFALEPRSGPPQRLESPSWKPGPGLSCCQFPWLKLEHDFSSRPSPCVLAVKHEQITQFSLSINSKLHPEEVRVASKKELRDQVIDALLATALDFRFRSMQQDCASPAFTEIYWELGMSAPERCGLNSLTIECEANRWRDAVGVAVSETQRVSLYGLGMEEMLHALETVVVSFEQAAERWSTNDHDSLMEELIDCVCSGDEMSDPRVTFDLVKSMKFSVDEVRARAGHVLSLVTQFLQSESNACAFACLPAEGAEDFTEGALFSVIGTALENVTAVEREKVPDALLDREELASKCKADKVCFVRAANVGGEYHQLLDQECQRCAAVEDDDKKSMDDDEEEGEGDRVMEGVPSDLLRGLSTQVYDPQSGVTLMTLSNGAKVTMKKTNFDKAQCSVCVHASGGIALEEPGRPGAVQLGISTMTDSGCDSFSADLIERFCARWGVTLTDACSPEGLYLWFTFSSRDAERVERAFEILHTVVSRPRFEDKALERAKRDVRLSHSERLRSLERTVQNECFANMFQERDPRMVDLAPEDVDALDQAAVSSAVLKQLCPTNIEVIIVGDFDEDLVKKLLVLYVGTIPRLSPPGIMETPAKVAKREGGFSLKMSGVAKRVETSVLEEISRACVMLTFPTFNRWGVCSAMGELANPPDPSAWNTPAREKNGAMYWSRCICVATEIVNTKLVQHLRERMGLVYGIQLTWAPFEVYDTGLLQIEFSPSPDAVDVASAQVRKVLESVMKDGFTQEDFKRAASPLISSVQESVETNAFWLETLCHIQTDLTPKETACLRDVPGGYSCLTLQDVNYVARRAFSLWSTAVTECVGITARKHMLSQCPAA